MSVIHATLGATPMRILDLLRQGRRLSRVEIAGEIEVTQAAVTRVVTDLMDLGLVREGERELGARGAPRRLLELVPERWYTVGVQFDQTSTTVVLADFAGNLVTSAEFAGTGQASPATFIAALADNVRYVLARARVPMNRVLGVGLVTYGPQDRESGVLLTSYPTPEWHGFPLTETLAGALDLPVLLENDATAAAVSVQATGQLTTATYGLIYLATGVGGAVVVDGEPYRGRSSNAVEIDHVVVVPDGNLCVCGSRGFVGAEAQPMEVADLAKQRHAMANRLGLSGSGDDALADFERIARAARSGDLEAEQLLLRSANLLGMAAVTMFNLFDLDTLVLAGPALRFAGELYRERLEAAVLERAANRELSQPAVHLARDLAGAAPMGGALQVLRTISPTPR